jgi:NNP family nitrate/nitrite transporter-like MFS transporter
MARKMRTVRKLPSSEPRESLVKSDQQATRVNLFDFRSPPMRAFHMAWMAFFLCFFAWFGIAPLMPVVRDELSLTKDQIGWCVIASVSITIIARLVIGWLCDRVGPRLSYSALLVVGSLPVMAIGFSHDFTSFLIFRLLIGVIGASFVVTQVHTSIMFAPNCVGTANGAAAGWGNLGGGVTQFVMPLVYGVLMTGVGLSSALSWRMAMFFAGAICFLMGIAYYLLTQDTPTGSFAELRRKKKASAAAGSGGGFLAACADPRTWVLFLVYGACFGVELTIDNIAVLYFTDHFGLGLIAAGWCAGLFGAMNVFARALGGLVSDRVSKKWGLQARMFWLFAVLLGEGLLLIVFANSGSLWMAIPLLMGFGLFVKMSNGATYAVVPFLNRGGLGAVSGIVGAGGNAGAVAAGFLLKNALDWSASLQWLGICVVGISTLALTVRLAERAQPQIESEPGLEGSLVQPA